MRDNQLDHHLAWLQSLGFTIDTLTVGSWVKCRGPEEPKPSGAFAYKTFVNELRGGGQGIITLAKVHGQDHRLETLPSKGFSEPSLFRLSPSSKEEQERISADELKKHKEAAKKARGFWGYSLISGQSDYLMLKGVGSYDIRFRVNEYGKVAVIPMRDSAGALWNYQLLNSDGTKLFSKEGRVDGLIHCLAPLVDGKLIGIGESYVTSATCLELSGVPTVCAFSSTNLSAVTKIILEKYPKSQIVIFADNDRHHEQSGKPNEGRLKALQAQKLSETRIALAMPDFGDCKPSKDASDWNDLVRLKGREVAVEQMMRFLDNIPSLYQDGDKLTV